MFSCDECDATFQSKGSLGGHKTAIHSQKECEFCGRLMGRGNLAQHRKSCSLNPKNRSKCSRDGCEKMTDNNKYCSRGCVNRAKEMKMKPQGPPCKRCNEPIPNQNKLFCSSKCRRLHKKESVYNKIENGEEIPVTEGMQSTWLRRYLIEKNGAACEECGWNEVNSETGKVPIEIHHIDGDASNNTLDNVKLLCPNCHSLTNSHKSLNRGNSTIERRKYRGSHDKS